MSTVNNQIKNKILTFEDWKKDNEFILYSSMPDDDTKEKTNKLNNDELDKRFDIGSSK